MVVKKILEHVCPECKKRIEELEEQAKAKLGERWGQQRPRRIYFIEMPMYAGGKDILVFDGGHENGDLHIYEHKKSIMKFEGTLHQELLKIIQSYGSEGRHYISWSITSKHDALIEEGP